MEQLEVDLALVAQHRKEAGAPDPRPLEEVPLPAMPAPPRRVPPPGRAAGGAGGADAAARRPKPKPPSMPPSASAMGAPRGGATASILVDARTLGDFVAKWKLDLIRTKTVLARLPPSRRKEVVDNFRHVSKETSATVALERYVAQRVPASMKRPFPSGPPREAPSKLRRTEGGPIGAAPPSAAAGPGKPRGSAGPSRDAPPWRGSAGASPPALRRAPQQPKAKAPTGKAPAGGGGSKPVPSRRPVLTTSGAPTTAKPGDLIKSLLG